MRRYALTLFIGALIALPLAFCKADLVTVVVGFEGYADPIGGNSAWTDSPYGDRSKNFPNNFGTTSPVETNYGSLNERAYEIGGVTFYSRPYHGTSISTVTDTTYNSYENDMASVTGSGNNGSQTYAVVFGDSTTGLPSASELLPRISLPTGALLQSIAITNTVYTYGNLTGTDPYGFSLPISSEGDFFNLIIYGLIDGGLLGSKTISLGQFLDGAASVLSDWMTVDLTDLSGAEELRFAFDGNDIGYGQWLNQPVYFAFDDLTYLIDDGTPSSSAPEPATMLIVGLGFAGFALRRKK